VNAGEFQGRRRRFPIVARNVDRYLKRRLIDNWREVGGSFKRVIGPGSWNEPRLKDDL
jgi:hypothetical protein